MVRILASCWVIVRISAILDHHPEICQMDEFVLEAFLDTPVKQIEKLTGNTKGLSQCVFFYAQTCLNKLNPLHIQ